MAGSGIQSRTGTFGISLCRNEDALDWTLVYFLGVWYWKTPWGMNCIAKRCWGTILYIYIYTRMKRQTYGWCWINYIAGPIKITWHMWSGACFLKVLRTIGTNPWGTNLLELQGFYHTQLRKTWVSDFSFHVRFVIRKCMLPPIYLYPEMIA